jgi:hypothetical protein
VLKQKLAQFVQTSIRVLHATALRIEANQDQLRVQVGGVRPPTKLVGSLVHLGKRLCCLLGPPGSTKVECGDPTGQDQGMPQSAASQIAEGSQDETSESITLRKDDPDSESDHEEEQVGATREEWSCRVNIFQRFDHIVSRRSVPLIGEATVSTT